MFRHLRLKNTGARVASQHNEPNKAVQISTSESQVGCNGVTMDSRCGSTGAPDYASSARSLTPRLVASHDDSPRTCSTSPKPRSTRSTTSYPRHVPLCVSQMRHTTTRLVPRRLSEVRHAQARPVPHVSQGRPSRSTPQHRHDLPYLQTGPLSPFSTSGVLH